MLGQLAVDDKSNEITAVPKLLDLLSLKGCIVTADALLCQRTIAAKVIERGGDSVLALKGNQGTLHDDVRRFLDDPIRPVEVSHTTVDGEHGRIETRTSLVSSDIGWLQKLGIMEQPHLTGTRASMHCLVAKNGVFIGCDCI